MKSDANPMNPAQRLRDAPRCHARAKRTGERCKCPTVKGWRVCRVHGAYGGAPTGPAHGRYRHGLFSAAAMSERRAIGELIRAAQKAAASAAPE